MSIKDEGVIEVKKQFFILALVLAALLALPAFALSPRVVQTSPRISFNGTMASCSVVVTGNQSKDNISIVMKLWNGGTCVKTWEAKATGYLYAKESAAVVSGKTYSLTVDVTIDGKALPTVTTSGTCK